jgi:predicted transcriptional regulator
MLEGGRRPLACGAALAALTLLAAAGLAAATPAPSGPAPGGEPTPPGGSAPAPPPTSGAGDEDPAAPEANDTVATPTGPAPASASADANGSGQARVSAEVGGDEEATFPAPNDGAAGGGGPEAQAEAETLPEPEGRCAETPILHVYVLATPSPGPPITGAQDGPTAEAPGGDVDRTVGDPRDHRVVKCTTSPNHTVTAGPNPWAGPPVAAPAREALTPDPVPSAADPQATPPEPDDGPSGDREDADEGRAGDARTQARTPSQQVRRGALTLALAALAVPAAGALYRRLTRDDVLENETRQRILDLVEDRPGVTAAEVSEALDVHYRTARHHLEVLEEFGHVEAVELGARIRYFENHERYGDLAKRVVAALGSETKRTVLMEIARRGGARSGELAEAAEVAPSTASHHLDDLEGKGLVEGRRRGRAVLYSLQDGVLPALLELAPAPADPGR